MYKDLILVLLLLGVGISRKQVTCQDQENSSSEKDEEEKQGLPFTAEEKKELDDLIKGIVRRETGEGGVAVEDTHVNGKGEDDGNDMAKDGETCQENLEKNYCSKSSGKCGNWNENEPCSYLVQHDSWCQLKSKYCRCCIPCYKIGCQNGGNCREKCKIDEVPSGSCGRQNCLCCVKSMHVPSVISQESSCNGKCADGCGSCKESCSENEDALSHHCGESKKCKCCKQKQRGYPLYDEVATGVN